MKRLVFVVLYFFCIVCFSADVKPKLFDKAFTFSNASDFYRPNDCNALMVDGIFDVHNVFGSVFQQRNLLNRFCSAHYSSYGEANKDSVSIGIPISELMASFGFSGESSKFNTEYQTLCSQQDAYTTSNQTVISQARNANASLAHEFTQCVQNQTFTAYVEPADPTQFQIIVNYKPAPGQPNVAKIKSFDYDKSSVSCSDFPHNGLGSPSIPNGGAAINCRRTDEKRVSLLSLSTDVGFQSFKVPAYLPPPVQPPVTSAVGDVVMSLLDKTTFSQQHINQKWISCDEIHAGLKKAPTGSAWARITGNSDLPDCANRYPRSAITGGAKVGSVYEDQIANRTHHIQGLHIEASGGHGFDGAGLATNSARNGPYTGSYATDNDGGTGDGTETRPKTAIFNFYVRVD